MNLPFLASLQHEVFLQVPDSLISSEQDHQPQVHANMISRPQNFRSPIILDDAYEFAEAVGLSIAKDSPGGPLANSDIETAWLSMSRYEKSQIPQVKGTSSVWEPLEIVETSGEEIQFERLTAVFAEYDPTRPIQDPVYLAYAQPSFAQPHVNASSSPYTRAISQVPYATSASLQPRTGFNEPAPFSDPTSHQLPEISSYTPQQGPPGTRVFIYFSCTYDIATLPALTYTVMFATRQCGSALTRLSQQGLYHDYVLTADAPPYTATDWSSSEVPLSINVQDGAGSEVGSVDVGPYTYTGYVQQPLSTSAQEGSRKRKVSLESAEATHLPAKRSSTQHLRQEGGEGSFEAPTYAQQRNSVYVQQNQSYAADPSYGNLMPYHRSPNQTYYQPAQRSPRRVSHHLSTSSASSVSQLRGPSPQTPAWSPPNLALTQHSKSPNVSTTAVSRLSSVSSPSNTANPPLIRTSTMQQPPSPGSAPSGPPGTSSFNPYRMYPHKAVLKINGNLETMVDDWSDAELTVKRRLVQFWRSQSSSTITTNFKPVTPEDRQPHSICISCIWWESKQECFITSVDTIFLLESLVAVRFTVEEKNRIRRNLEGFRPLTVSKGKSDSEDFFKLIMGFPAPKPRNIEKDVKVFPWKILTHALKKIISKYVSRESRWDVW